MIEKNKVIENVKKSTSFILKFLGYAKRIPPKIVEKKKAGDEIRKVTALCA